MKGNKLIIASSNKGKISEFQKILPHFECIPQSAFNIFDVEETGNVLFSTFDTSILGGEYAGTEMIYNLDKVSLKYWRIVREKASERRMVQNNYQCKEAKKNPFGN